jgi:RimJ/RimL family protein N-acetyltransferase
MNNFTPLETSRLLLRRIEYSDSEAVLAYRIKPEVARFQSWETPNLGEIRIFAAEMEILPVNQPGTWFQLVLVLRESGSVIGDIGMHFLPQDSPQVEVGITLDSVYQGKGYATEALSAVLEYLFLTLNKHRIFASVDPRNGASVALLERVGMRREAHFRESLWFKGAWADDYVYAILGREYRSVEPG